MSINNSLQKILNYHGYAFQYAVLRFSEDLFRQMKSNWLFKWSEFPVQINNVDTRIDFVLENKQNGIFIVAECKRVNPAYSNWCFVKTPYIRRNTNENNVIIDFLEFVNDVHYVSPIVLTTSPNLYHLGVEVKSGEKGDSGFTSRNAIEEAASQAFRGVNGLILEFAKRGEKVLSRRKSAWFIPVIFTTAKIWTSEIDLGTADLETGKIGLDDLKAEEKKWIWLEYHVSPGIKHHLSSSEEINKEQRDILLMNYTRTIAIVNYGGIRDFLIRDFSS